MHNRWRCFYLFILLAMTGCSSKVKLEQTKVLDTYASGSGMVYLNDKLYLMGDDMSYLLVLDTAFNVLDTMTIMDSVTNPIPKPVKADIESVAIVPDEGQDALLLLGSGSFDYHRDKAWLVHTLTKQRTEINLQPFYNRLRAQGLKDLNIEGVMKVNDNIILAARGDKKTPVNHLVFTSKKFWSDQVNAAIDIKVVSPGTKNDKQFHGISGLEYSKKSDCLILTVSTENTTNAYDDGTIGTSYLWLVHNFSQKIHDQLIVPDRIIDLVRADGRFKGQKIESACVIQEDARKLKLALAADNDNGKTGLFTIIVTD